jgi:hypothetical protein
MDDLVGPNAGGSGRFDRGLDQDPIGFVQIERLATDRIGLLSKAHDHEAGRLLVHVVTPPCLKA